MKFSIITVSFNSGNTIERTIKSILAQTFNDYEYIIVDGGSKDNTLDIVKKYEPLFEGRMKWKSEQDKGIYNAMNKGINRASGDIIGIVNSDDWLEPTACEVVANLSKYHKIDELILYCGSMRFHYNNMNNQIFESNEERFTKGIAKYSYNHGAFHPAIWVNRNVYVKIGFFDEEYKIGADTDFIYRCFLFKCKFVFTKNVLTNMSDGGVSNKTNYKNHISDKIHYLNKYGKKKFIGTFQLLNSLAITFLRNNMPNQIIKLYRSFKFYK